MSDDENRPAGFVEALAKGIAILESFDASHSEMTLSEVARRVDVSPAAARRGLITLIELGYVGQNAKRFHLKPKVMALGSSFYFATRVDEIILPDLRRLVETFGDAASVGTLNDHNVIYVAHYSQQRARRASAVVGASYPAFATSIGRVVLAGLPDDRLDQWLETLSPVPLTSRTLIDKDALRDEILRVREQGYAATVDQLDYGITAIAVPIVNEEGRTVAAINSSGYSGMVAPEALVSERLHELRAVASSIALQLGRYPTLRAVLGD
ncbi:IclR family transcriptional regulator domain-containing protein [Pararhodobacter zhoushanensis]|uniref:Helix-turn-helix domain-containing protein n=1 Tax=Pararhodobacter zhoushanensis TaxID=2479545 RepID=A0ABT3GV52_9RHOB|nr:IclR family transcriptional regulator C-terminal domain-containing protein [Pararhodobacter zhoushanensis]MCW1931407.1 helix-turn-helix domain-containing protein [Pararhodobacter zhoushanensis]